MYRKVMEQLEAWRASEWRKPLILQGARQVGKTYSLLELGRKMYDNVAYFNFETDSSLIDIFGESISPAELIPSLSVSVFVPHQYTEIRGVWRVQTKPAAKSEILQRVRAGKVTSCCARRLRSFS